MIKMKALRSANMGVNSIKVRRGREFDVVNEQRARELEDNGLAYRLNPEMTAVPPLNPASRSNEAAQAGPLGSVGGETGAETAPLSSDQDHPQRTRRSRKPRAGFDL